MVQTSLENYRAQLNLRIDIVFASHPEIHDHRADYPWVEGFLGDPFSGIWFVAENPSLVMVRRGASKGNKTLTHETMWAISPGDLLLREMLVEQGFKEGGPTSPGGWRCYITDVLKSAVEPGSWNRLNKEERWKAVRAWSDVLSWELDIGRPRLLVAIGKPAEDWLNKLESKNLMPRLPEIIRVQHYAYIGQRADAKRRLGPMDPVRVSEYRAQFAEVRRRFERTLG